MHQGSTVKRKPTDPCLSINEWRQRKRQENKRARRSWKDKIND